MLQWHCQQANDAMLHRINRGTCPTSLLRDSWIYINGIQACLCTIFPTKIWLCQRTAHPSSWWRPWKLITSSMFLTLSFCVHSTEAREESCQSRVLHLLLSHQLLHPPWSVPSKVNGCQGLGCIRVDMVNGGETLEGYWIYEFKKRSTMAISIMSGGSCCSSGQEGRSIRSWFDHRWAHSLCCEEVGSQNLIPTSFSPCCGGADLKPSVSFKNVVGKFKRYGLYYKLHDF